MNKNGLKFGDTVETDFNGSRRVATVAETPGPNDKTVMLCMDEGYYLRSLKDVKPSK